jgi:putative endonuclease
MVGSEPNTRSGAVPWYLYIVECQGGSLYTGISTDVSRRFAQHLAGRGARYTRLHPPLRLMLTLEFDSRSAALKAEYSLKQMSRTDKQAFCLRHGATVD